MKNGKQHDKTDSRRRGWRRRGKRLRKEKKAGRRWSVNIAAHGWAKRGSNHTLDVERGVAHMCHVPFHVLLR